MIKGSAVASIGLTFCVVALMKERPRCDFGKSLEIRLKTDIRVLEHAVTFYQTEFGVPLLTLSKLMEPDPPFVTVVPLDPWGAEYLLEIDPAGEHFRIGTYGEGGIPGGRGDDADVFSEWRARI